MLINKFKLPLHLDTPLTDYAVKVLTTPELYTFNYSNKVPHYNCESIFDPTVPGLSDEFILNWDKTNINWGNVSLQRHSCSNLFKLAFPPFELSVQLIEYFEDYVQKQLVTPSGNFLYPKGGYMGWHTNSNMPGYRIYIAYSPDNDSSYFKYYDNLTNTVIEDKDEKGWTARLFEISDHPSKHFWHCVYAYNNPRISFGYWFK